MTYAPAPAGSSYTGTSIPCPEEEQTCNQWRGEALGKPRCRCVGEAGQRVRACAWEWACAPRPLAPEPPVLLSFIVLPGPSHNLLAWGG